MTLRRGLLVLSAALLFASGAEAQSGRDDSPQPIPAVARLKPAEIRAEQLDKLFARLIKSADDAEAQRIEQSIWSLWMTSDSPTADALLAQAMKASAANETAAALSILDNVIEVHPDYAEAWNKRATVYFIIGRYNDSLSDIDKVLELEPRHFGALSGRGMIKRQQGDLGAARAAFEEALGFNPHMDGAKRALEEIESEERPI
ncbi:tetratricopeptide repeat protein [Taklimakanibacter deserti]|jgi:tetratricopeptide (TPR) repeat protein|uniref:tetratricopeptide repeat protein n=1 Tax=Taklimakanibacter deserti TaxID=2267839 RepID=UPI000E65B9A4